MAAAPKTSAELLALIRKSGIVEGATLDSHVVKLQKAAGMPQSPTQLAGILIEDGLLTDFQGENLLRGKYSGFTLGKYRIMKRIGSGGMGAVFLAEHRALRRIVALKVLPADKADDPACLGRFHREAQAVAALSHPNIVRAYDVDKDGKTYFLVMEYVEGLTLQELVRQRGPLDIALAADIIKQVASGLDHAHRAGLVHRDIKPANILISGAGAAVAAINPVGASERREAAARESARLTHPDPLTSYQIKILDMGLARFFNDDGDPLTREFENNAVLGTADYLSPEQGRDSHEVDTRSDVYSLGATFYFLLTGRPPFAGGDLRQKLLWHQIKLPEPVRTHRPEVPESLDAIIAKMMAKDVADRFQTPAEVVQALSSWASAASEDSGSVAPTSDADESLPSAPPRPPTSDDWSALIDTVRYDKSPTALTKKRIDKGPFRPPSRLRLWPVVAAAAGGLLLVFGIGWLMFAGQVENTPQIQQLDPPVHLRASDGAFSAIELTWENRATHSSGIQIERANDSKFSQYLVILGTVPPGTTRFSDRPLATGLPIFYRVSAVTAAGETASSNVASPAPSYGKGFNSNGIILNGGASVAGTSLRLTDATTPKAPQARSAFYGVPLSVLAFSTTFRFQIAAGANSGEGFTFCIQNNEPGQVGAGGAGLGYAGTPRSVGVKFDLANTAGKGNGSTGLFQNGVNPSNPGSVDLKGTGIDLHNGHAYEVALAYKTGHLDMKIRDVADSKKTFQKAFAVDIPATVGGSSAYFGFTGGTSAIGAVQDVLTWTYRAESLP